MGKKKNKKAPQRHAKDAGGATVRIAVVSQDRCKPNKCGQECKRSCPVVRQGKLCIEVRANDKIAKISEILCIGCNICIKKCPFNAIQIINLPKNLNSSTTHRFGPNSFKLHRLPHPRPNQVLGLVGTNGIGKSTALKVLSGKIKPNLGRFVEPPTWELILEYFRGSELQNYFTRLLEDELKALMKPQYVDHIPKKIKSGTVKKILKKKDQRGKMKKLMKALDLKHLGRREVPQLSGGELQRFAICAVLGQKADVYMFDEPSSYLDIKQRINAAKAIRQLLSDRKTTEKSIYLIVVEHDLSILDYLSDYVCCLYGKPGVYGVVTMPFGVREGINIFLRGFIPTEQMRFRDWELNFKLSEQIDRELDERGDYEYPHLEKTLGDFHLEVETGNFKKSEIIVMLGENGTGKTTFVKLLAGLMQPDNGEDVPELAMSYKPQKISPKFPGTVQQLLHRRIRNIYLTNQFQTDVMKPMKMAELMDRVVTTLSGGELQRTALVLALGTPADIYLLDEPSAYLDVEQRVWASKVIKRYILHSKKTAFIVEHDFIMATYLADKVIVYEGDPGRDCVARTPQTLLDGMNLFLRNIEVTFRRDPTNYRPRINKEDSQKDIEQKLNGHYFFLDADD